MWPKSGALPTMVRLVCPRLECRGACLVCPESRETAEMSSNASEGRLRRNVIKCEINVRSGFWLLYLTKGMYKESNPVSAVGVTDTVCVCAWQVACVWHVPCTAVSVPAAIPRYAGFERGDAHAPVAQSECRARGCGVPPRSPWSVVLSRPQHASSSPANCAESLRNRIWLKASLDAWAWAWAWAWA